MKKLSGIPLVLALALVVAAPASAKPPSFALWLAKRDARMTHLLAPVKAKCMAIAELTNDDGKTGECMAQGFLKIWPRSSAPFDRGVRLISAPQAPPCRRAIHAWWLAVNKASAAMLIYLPANQHVTVTEFDRDLNSGTIGTLGNIADEAKSRAVRVCG